MDGNVVVQAPMGDSDPTADKKARQRAAKARCQEKKRKREGAAPAGAPEADDEARHLKEQRKKWRDNYKGKGAFFAMSRLAARLGIVIGACSCSCVTTCVCDALRV